MTRSYTRIGAENMKKSEKEGVDCYRLLLLSSHFINYSCFGSHESSLCLLPLWSDSSRNRLFWEQPVKATYYSTSRSVSRNILFLEGLTHSTGTTPEQRTTTTTAGQLDPATWTSGLGPSQRPMSGTHLQHRCYCKPAGWGPSQR
jgi:hypothetical protein